jgi:hypothetical protein
MRDGASFAEILETHLGCMVVPPAAPRGWSNRPLTTPLFAFDFPLTAGHRQAGLKTRSHEPVEPSRPVHLTSLERQTLEDAQTPDALRRAYRTLAQRYHPDRHPTSSLAERERVARLFAEATEHYRLLTRRF